MLVSYEEYKNAGGGLDETAYNIYGYEAERLMQSKTHNRIKAVTEPIKYCFARVCDIMEKADVTADKVSSWSNDGVSGSFEKTEITDYIKKAEEIIHNYLINETDEEGTPLLYLGGVLYD